jgi:hypothetical protein
VIEKESLELKILVFELIKLTLHGDFKSWEHILENNEVQQKLRKKNIQLLGR